ncbi:MAG: Fe-S cluster assembly protein SufD [Cryomorphaceae bacterium]
MDLAKEMTKEQAVLDSLRSSYQSAVPESFSSLSSKSLLNLESLEFPTTKLEYWKYTRTGQIANKEWKFGGLENVDIPENLPVSKHRMVFVNGQFDEKRSSLPQMEGLTILPFSKSSVASSIAQAEEDIFRAWNTAMPQDGYHISVAKNKAIENALQIVFLYSGENTISQPRSFVELAENSELKISEFHIHSAGSMALANVHSEAVVGDNAHLKIDVIQHGSEKGFHLQETYGEQGKNCTYMQNTFTLSGNWTRNNSTIRLTDEHSECNLNGFYIPNLKEHVDNHTIIDHEKANCESHELYRGVLLDKSTGVFNGKVFVRQDAQKTNAFQSNGNIIVSDTATMNSKPELEIYADDVKCSHGSTTGQLDDDAMFYLMARGLSKESSRKLLINAFAEDVLEKLVNEDLREIIEDTIHTKLA